MTDSDLQKSRRALLLVDFINPLAFPGAEDLAENTARRKGTRKGERNLNPRT